MLFFKVSSRKSFRFRVSWCIWWWTIPYNYIPGNKMLPEVFFYD